MLDVKKYSTDALRPVQIIDLLESLLSKTFGSTLFIDDYSTNKTGVYTGNASDESGNLIGFEFNPDTEEVLFS